MFLYRLLIKSRRFLKHIQKSMFPISGYQYGGQDHPGYTNSPIYKFETYWAKDKFKDFPVLKHYLQCTAETADILSTKQKYLLMSMEMIDSGSKV
jgi:hypothetical protein